MTGRRRLGASAPVDFGGSQRSNACSAPAHANMPL